MKINLQNPPLPSISSTLFGLLLISLMPALLILERFKVFLLVVFMQLGILAYAFIEPAYSLAMHLALLFVLIINSVRQSL
jgi:hypothetical protein